MSAYNGAWQKVFDKYSIPALVAEQGFADVTADQLREFREPRLLTKMDHSHQLPKVFEENKLTILTRGISTFRIGAFEVYRDLPEWTVPAGDVENLSLPAYIETLDTTNITGEPAALNAAHAAGIMDRFCGEEVILTVSGRMRTGAFSFSVNDTVRGKAEIPVAGAQIEIDGAFEGKDAFTIVEVKNHLSKDFLVRQLYYPFRALREKAHKPTRTVFLTLANDVYDLHEFDFVDPFDYSSATLTRHKRYTIGVTPPTEAEVVEQAKKVLQAAPSSKRSDIPFPQADDFERVMDLVSYLSEKPRTADDLAVSYAFDIRQSSYYANAARYLGLADYVQVGSRREWRTTPLADEILALPYRDKNLRFAALALSISPVAETYFEWVRDGSRPTVERVAEMFSKHPDGEHLAPSTQLRRSQTILSWATWLRQIAPSK